MKKTIITRMLVLTLAISGLFVIGNNVYSNQLLEVNICQLCGHDPVPPGTQCPVCGWFNDGDDGAAIRYCLLDGGQMLGWVRKCLDPGYHTLPPYECGERYMINGKRFEQCF